MKNWFEVKVKYNKTNDEGKEQKVSESYLFDAVSWTEAEARTFEQLKEIISGDFRIEAIKKSRIIELFAFDSGEYWFKVTVEMFTIDEQAKKEKKVKEAFLIMADNVQEALNRMNQSLDCMLVPFSISSISVSNIYDVFPYNGIKEAKRIIDELKESGMTVSTN